MCTVRVGTGVGNRSAQMAAISQVMMFQEKIQANPAQTIVNESKMYAALDDFCRFSGLNSANRYFLDPTSQEGMQVGQQKSQQMQQQQMEQKQNEQMMMKVQTDLAQAELQKAQAQMGAAQARAESDQVKNQMKAQEQAAKYQIEQLRQQLEQARLLVEAGSKDNEFEQRIEEHEDQVALELTRIEATTNTEQNANYNENRNGQTGAI